MKSTDEKGRVLEHRLKQYVAEQTYNSVALAVTGVTVTRGVFIPYQTLDGAYRMRFSIWGIKGSSANFTITIAGVVFKTGFKQAFVSWDYSSRYGCIDAHTNGGDGNMLIYMVGATVDSMVSGDLELDSLPTWADPE